jgi:hypothetical protein
VLFESIDFSKPLSFFILLLLRKVSVSVAPNRSSANSSFLKNMVSRIACGGKITFGEDATRIIQFELLSTLKRVGLSCKFKRRHSIIFRVFNKDIMVASSSFSSSSASPSSHAQDASFVNHVSVQEERRNQLNRAREQLNQLVRRVESLQMQLSLEETEERKQATKQAIVGVVLQAVNTAERVLRLFELTRI